IMMYINSPGGSITAGLAIYDTMQFIKPHVQTVCIGKWASMAEVRLAAGEKGKRYSLPNSRIVIHQPLMQGLAGQATDIDIAAREILRMRERLNEILVHHTGQPFKRIQDDTERDYIMSADQGKEYGIIDDVIRKRVYTRFRYPGVQGDKPRPFKTIAGYIDIDPRGTEARWSRRTARPRSFAALSA